jgi:hypothetical protein
LSPRYPVYRKLGLRGLKLSAVRWIAASGPGTGALACPDGSMVVPGQNLYVKERNKMEDRGVPNLGEMDEQQV